MTKQAHKCTGSFFCPTHFHTEKKSRQLDVGTSVTIFHFGIDRVRGDSLILQQDFFGFYLITPLAKVDLAHPVGVDWVPLVRVDDHLHISRELFFPFFVGYDLHFIHTIVP